MQKYAFWDGPDSKEPTIITEDEIVSQYYPYWCERMNERFGKDRDTLFDIEDCIEDFCIIHWAWKV